MADQGIPRASSTCLHLLPLLSPLNKRLWKTGAFAFVPLRLPYTDTTAGVSRAS